MLTPSPYARRTVTCVALSVAGDVGQRLLHDAVGGQLDRRGQGGSGVRRRPSASTSSPPAPHAVDQRVEIGQCRAPAPAAPRRRGAARRARCAARAAPRGWPSLMLVSAGSRLLGLLVDQVQGDAGLHVDQRDVVGEHVVQLLGQQQPLLADAALLAPPAAARVARATGRGATRTSSATASSIANHPATSASGARAPDPSLALRIDDAGDDEADEPGRPARPHDAAAAPAGQQRTGRRRR